MIKTAEDWYNEKEYCGDEDSDGNLLDYAWTIEDIKSIQLDATKHGLTIAIDTISR